MNERIRELARQAFNKERKESCPDWKESELSEALLKDFEVVFENFAELIVLECIDKAERYGLGCDAVEQLKEDFGVEE